MASSDAPSHKTSKQRRTRKERERLRKLELTRVRSRAKVAGRGRGRPRKTEAERAEKAAQAAIAKRALAEERRRAALPTGGGDAEWQSRYEQAYETARSHRSPETLEALAVVYDEYPTASYSNKDRLLVVALMARDRERRAEEAAAKQPFLQQCEGTTLAGRQCLLTSLHCGSNAAPLREGGTRCVHHRLDTFTGTQCEGITSRGARCCVFSAAGYVQARPLQRGFKFCTWHAWQASLRLWCEGTTAKGARCRVSSWDLHPGAMPLREGCSFCEAHSQWQDVCAPVCCADCGGMEGLCEEEAGDGSQYCNACWEAWDV
jgi:hypothetical protein